MRQSGEPSVEEILASIKQVIARDNRADAADRRRERESRGIAQLEPGNDDDMVGDDDEDVLDLEMAAEIDDEEGTPPADTPLVNPEARTSMRESLAALAVLAEPGAQPQIVRSGETSLESLTRELLRPALSDWLDRNLPSMVERMVATEIARIVGKKG